ncbi:FIG004454: RNA binding protein [hydrothermal vent metagenome]|uniref:FIG004454: RNA binding protein n=1 Tax=hydrothermal vent metagenome TaxID=652676 RepID=A0A1W1CSB2_9ZZZZ
MKNNQKKFLRSLAHSLKPIILIGQNGLTDGVLSELENTLAVHELVKIKMRCEDKEEKQQNIDNIIKYTNAKLVQVVGGVLVIYRAFTEDPVIRLPK